MEYGLICTAIDYPLSLKLWGSLRTSVAVMMILNYTTLLADRFLITPSLISSQAPTTDLLSPLLSGFPETHQVGEIISDSEIFF
jgi:hypothetical protein